MHAQSFFHAHFMILCTGYIISIQLFYDAFHNLHKNVDGNSYWTLNSQHTEVEERNRDV